MSPEIHFRPEQHAVVYGYQGGKLGIAAVPGSGKTFTLSYLAARLVEELTAQGLTQGLERQEVLVVTFTNTAVNSFRSRIAEILQQERGLLPYVGYRVRTLHGLAHDIVRERPALAGLSEDFQIVDERVSDGIIRDVAQSLLGEYKDVFASYLDPGALATERQSRRIERQELPELAVGVARQFIKHAKDHRLDPVSLRAALVQSEGDLPLARFGVAVYEDYQRSLGYRGAVDFDDLVRLAILALQEDPPYCERLRRRWPYILEDEAQDSSQLQEEMLRLLSGGRNWVRVGDPNQAINTTFTTANPQFLRDFLSSENVEEIPLRTSGRSALPIIDLANTLVRWAVHHHPVLALREAFHPQEIRPAGPDDPQPNPRPEEARLHIHYQPGQNITPDLELELVASSIEQFLAEGNPGYTVAVLAPENSRGYKLAEVLYARGIEYEELLRSTTATRKAATVLRWALQYLGDPLNPKALARLYREVWWPSHFCSLGGEEEQLQVAWRVLSACRHVEQFIWPSAGEDWLDDVPALAEQPEVLADLDAFRGRVRVWLQGVALPVDQLVLTLTQDLFVVPADIALGYKVAAVLRGMAQSNPGWRLPEFAEELRAISENQRKFIGFDDVERGYEPTPGRVTVATMHAAKGLEWDRVYLMGVSNYGFPSAQPYDNYLAERWFVRDGLNLEAEALAQLDALLGDPATYREGIATGQARLDYAAERLRLLYVGITRAKRELVITWNVGRFWQQGGNFVNQPALPLVVLWEHLQGVLRI
ncbi:MAG: ATP-dependent helicase [Anaerolineae bacterium]